MSDAADRCSVTRWQIGFAIDPNNTGKAMNFDHHHLHHECPEYTEAIHALKHGLYAMLQAKKA
jgi:hypothetical protein